MRVVLLDPADRLLLLWHSSPHDIDHWAPPGGGVEPGEELQEAAARELREEVGLAGLLLARPIWVWQHRFSYSGASILQHETIYACRLPTAEQPRGHRADLAADGIRGARWWSPADLDACTDEVWPRGLAGLARALVGQDLDPAQPRMLESE